jgi:hypothetical protein
VGEVDGDTADAITNTVRSGRLFGAGLRDLVGRYALRGADLGAFVGHDVAERTLADTSRVLGTDARAARRHLLTARGRVGLSENASADSVAQWLVTELIAPPTRALQLQLFGARRAETRPSGETSPTRE